MVRAPIRDTPMSFYLSRPKDDSLLYVATLSHRVERQCQTMYLLWSSVSNGKRLTFVVSIQISKYVRK